MFYIKKLINELDKNKGVRIGQTAVVSHKVHTIDPSSPENVHILVNNDIGISFYNRHYENEIFHIDLFHEIAICDVKKLAKNIINHLELKSKRFLADYLDIQTASGGGRLSGSLSYGLEKTIRKNHMNHVHLTGLALENNFEDIFFLVEKIEEGLMEQNIELRKIERLIHEQANLPQDKSSYTSNSDSFLKDNSFYNQFTESTGIEKEAIDIAEYFGTSRGIYELLNSIDDNGLSARKSNEIKEKIGDADDILEYLQKRGYIQKKSGCYKLTNQGQHLKLVFKLKFREIEMALKKAIKSFPGLTGLNGYNNLKSLSKGHYRTNGKTSISKPIERGQWLEELDISKTIMSSLTRCYNENKPFSISSKDLFNIEREQKIEQDICLVIDSSSSMSGDRLRNAKFLANILIMRTNRRVSVIAFQGEDVDLYVPFTRNFNVLEQGLNRIKSDGLTPLAKALDNSNIYLNSKHFKNPLIMLVTDGIPTVPLWTDDPLKDAITAARKIKKTKIQFCCIGLHPNKECLVDITKAADGKLFVVDELEKQALVDAVRESGQLL
jgi:magnesium chelatase subunit D